MAVTVTLDDDTALALAHAAADRLDALSAQPGQPTDAVMAEANADNYAVRLIDDAIEAEHAPQHGQATGTTAFTGTAQHTTP